MTLRSAIRALLVVALALPVVECVLMGVRGLLLSLGDERGAAIIGYVGTGCLVAWLLSLVGLLIVVAVVVVVEGPAEDNGDT
jgi:hypothetical protein